jgi:HD-like signal output (HDOD) protein/DNA-binding response OmpR family regulator
MVAPDTRNLRILLVEDTRGDQALVERMFRDSSSLPEPAALTIVADAEAALAAVRRQTFSLILTDYSLPGRTGLDLLRALREAHDETPVVMITGTGDEGVAVAALQEGAADYVVKELGFERTLPIVVERALRKRGLELELERSRHQVAEYARALEQRVDDQTRSLRRALQESEALRRVGQAMAAARELKPAVDLVTRTATELLQAQAAAVLVRAGTEFVLASKWGALKQAPGLKSATLPATIAVGWLQAATAPLREEGIEIGMLWVGRSRPQPFLPHDHELLEALADMTALGIANVRAHEQLKRNERNSERGQGDDQLAIPLGPSVEPEPTPAQPLPVRVSVSNLVVPSFPLALARLIALADEEADPEAIEETVGLDPALVTRAIQLASAAALGRARPASSIREALMVLGVRGIRNLAVAQFARRLLARSGVVEQLLWEQSLATAAGAQVVLEMREPAVAEDAYLCGLLHNVGEVALNNAHPDRYERVLHVAAGSGRPIYEVEREIFGDSAASVTHQLVPKWRLPARVAATLEKWRPDSNDTDQIVVALRWASALAFRANPGWQKLVGERGEPSWLTRELEDAERQLALAADKLDEARRLTAARSGTLRGLVT